MRLLVLACLLLAAAPARASRFAVYGDTRDNDAEHARIVAAVVAAKPDLALFTGDAVKDGTSKEEWTHWEALEKPLRDALKLYPVRGNHDVGKEFAAHFKLPPEGAKGGGASEAYAFDALGLHFLGLDTEEPLAAGSPQLEWAEKDLAAHANKPTIVFLHKALYSSGSHGGDAPLRALLTPLFEKGHVLAVFQSHDHDYERSKPINGVTYFVEGGGGARLRPMVDPAPPWSAFRFDGFGYVLVDVTVDALDIQAFDASGTLLDRSKIALTSATPPAPDAGH